MKEPIISVSGLRGIVGESLTPEVAMRFACAFTSNLTEGPVLVTRDGRHSGAMLADAIRSGICAIGRSVVDAGVAATPTHGVLLRSLQAAGGIQISASHNPPAYNGIKLFAADGQVLTAEKGRAVVDRYRAGHIPWVSQERIGSVTLHADTVREHARLLRDIVDMEMIRGRRFRVLLDANHGAGAVLGRELLRELGCTVTVLGEEPNGAFAHPPEPTAENLRDVCRHVRDTQVDVGFCQDPDADRLAIIDEQGVYIGEECTLVLCLDHVLRERQGPVVTNCATSRMAEDLAQKYRVPFHRSAVGEANVVEVMRAEGAVFGGEGNGGPIDPRVGYVRDSFVGMALVLNAMAARQMKLSELVAELPMYSIHKTKVSLPPERLASALADLQKHFRDANASTMDGLRLDWPGRWLLVRGSNTEPIVRVIAEAATQQEAERMCKEAAERLAFT